MMIMVDQPGRLVDAEWWRAPSCSVFHHLRAIICLITAAFMGGTRELWSGRKQHLFRFHYIDLPLTYILDYDVSVFCLLFAMFYGRVQVQAPRRSRARLA